MPYRCLSAEGSLTTILAPKEWPRRRANSCAIRRWPRTPWRSRPSLREAHSVGLRLEHVEVHRAAERSGVLLAGHSGWSETCRTRPQAKVRQRGAADGGLAGSLGRPDRDQWPPSTVILQLGGTEVQSKVRETTSRCRHVSQYRFLRGLPTISWKWFLRTRSSCLRRPSTPFLTAVSGKGSWRPAPEHATLPTICCEFRSRPARLPLGT